MRVCGLFGQDHFLWLCFPLERDAGLRRCLHTAGVMARGTQAGKTHEVLEIVKDK